MTRALRGRKSVNTNLVVVGVVVSDVFQPCTEFPTEHEEDNDEADPKLDGESETSK